MFRSKKAQTMGIPFQLIFSLIIIVVVVVFGFLAIKMFLERAEQTKYGVAFKDIESEIQDSWSRAGETNKTITINLPKKITAICFLNTSQSSCNPSIAEGFCENVDLYKTDKENLYFYPLGEAEKLHSKSGWALLCQDHSCISLKGNPQCFFKNGNDVQIQIIKNLDEQFVRLRE